MRSLVRASVVLCALLCVGCEGELTIDGSTPETMKASRDKMMASIEDEEKKAEFAHALNRLAGKSGTLNKTGDPAGYRAMFHGKTIDEIIAASKQ